MLSNIKSHYKVVMNATLEMLPFKNIKIYIILIPLICHFKSYTCKCFPTTMLFSFLVNYE